MPKPQSKNIPDMYTVLRQRILQDTYLPGEKLSENNLATEFNCSRTPIRESLKHLEQDGLVTISPRSGTYVKGNNELDFKNLMEVRAYMEGLAVRLAIEYKSSTHELKQILDDMDDMLCKNETVFNIGEKHYLFHRKLIELSQNELSIQLYDRLNLKSSLHFFQVMDKQMAEQTQTEHRLIVNYIDEQNPETEAFVIAHLWTKRTSLPTVK